MIDEYLKMGSVVEEEFRIMNQHHNYGSYRPQPQYIRENPKIHRNDPCVCGSGKKYKKCCK